MANALDYLMAVQQQKQLAEIQNSQAVNQGITNFANTFLAQKKLADDRNQTMLLTQATLASKGLEMVQDPNTGQIGFQRNSKLASNTDLIDELLKTAKLKQATFKTDILDRFKNGEDISREEKVFAGLLKPATSAELLSGLLGNDDAFSNIANVASPTNKTANNTGAANDPLANLRQQAAAAIKAGKDPDLVRKRFAELSSKKV